MIFDKKYVDILKDIDYIYFHMYQFFDVENKNMNINYLKIFTHGKRYVEINEVSSKLSDDISNDLKKRGMKFVGTKIIYSYLQAIGIIYSHDEGCYLYKNNLHIC